MSVPQLIVHRHLRRNRTALARRIDAFVAKPGHFIARCQICPRYARAAELTDRGWCPQCEREFARVMASLRRMGMVSRVR